MFVVGKNHIVNEWKESSINLKRLLNPDYGLALYTGETETAENGLLYEKGFCPVLTDEEKAKIIRKKRNDLLLISDWTQTADSPVACKEEWKQYRQKLRDLPEQSGFPENVEWPEHP